MILNGVMSARPYWLGVIPKNNLSRAQAPNVTAEAMGLPVRCPALFGARHLGFRDFLSPLRVAVAADQQGRPQRKHKRYHGEKAASQLRIGGDA